MLSEFQKYPRWCPKCNSLHQAVWKECTRCKNPLVSSLWRLPALIFKQLLSLVLIASVLGSFGVFTYLIQKPERCLYKQSYGYFKDGHYEESWDEFCKAFWYNPAARLARYGIDGVGKMFGTIHKLSDHSASSPGRALPVSPSTYSDRWAPSDQNNRTSGFVGFILGSLFLILAGVGVVIGMLLSGRKSTLPAEAQQEELKVYCKICHGLHREGNVFCPDKWQAASQDGVNSFFQRPASYEFRCKWRIKDQEYTGKFECEDEEDLKRHIETKGGALVEVFEKTKVLTKIIDKTSIEPR